jgi:hypothetical protein
MARDRPWQRGKRKRPSKNELWISNDGDRPSLLNFKGSLPFPPTIGGQSGSNFLVGRPCTGEVTEAKTTATRPAKPFSEAELAGPTHHILEPALARVCVGCENERASQLSCTHAHPGPDCLAVRGRNVPTRTTTPWAKLAGA